MGKREKPGEEAVAVAEPVEQAAESFISHDPKLHVWLQSFPVEQTVVNGKVVTRKERGLSVRFKDNFATVDGTTAEMLRKAKHYGRTFIAVSEVKQRLKSTDAGERRSLMPFIEKLERIRDHQNMLPITEKTVRLPD